MAEDKRADELITYLNSLGFEGEMLEAAVRNQHASSVPSFTVSHELEFGEEKMRYEFSFLKEGEGRYSLTEISATHTGRIDIAHRKVEGIDTADLEKRMAEADWQQWFNDHPDEQSWSSDKAIHGVLNDFFRLSSGGSFEGMQIQEQLQFKYLANAGFNPFNLDRIRRQYESTQKYQPDEHIPWTANLIFNDISGRLEYLAEQFIDMGINPYRQLNEQLARGNGEFVLTYMEPRNEGTMEVRVDVGLDEWGFYHASNEYTIALNRYPQFIHGVYGGVDTRELERQILQARPPLLWDVGPPFGFFPPKRLTETETGLLRKIETLAAQGNGNGKRAALKMMQRYFPEEALPVGFGVLPVTKDDGFSQVFFIDDVGIEKAWNQLCGRAIWLGDDKNEQNRGWLRADYSGDTVEGTEMEGMTFQETLGLLESLPMECPRANLYFLCREVCNGGRPLVELSNGARMYIEANPVERRLNFYDSGIRPLYGIPRKIEESQPEIGHSHSRRKAVRGEKRKAKKKKW